MPKVFFCKPFVYIFKCFEHKTNNKIMASIKYDPKYDFSNKGIDWEEYEREARLRTDAIWERKKLKDYFRIFYKVFFWDPKTEKYYITMPLHTFGNGTDGWRIKEFECYNPTGKTNSFQKARGWEYPSRTIGLNHSDSIRDKNALCYYRFRAYKKCEGNTLYSKIMEMDNEYGYEKVNLSCYQEMMEMVDSCSATQLNWLADLWHHVELHPDPVHFGRNQELENVPDEFDNPDGSVLTY